MIAVKDITEVLSLLLHPLPKKKRLVQPVTPICKNFSGIYEYEVWRLTQLF